MENSWYCRLDRLYMSRLDALQLSREGDPGRVYMPVCSMVVCIMWVCTIWVCTILVCTIWVCTIPISRVVGIAGYKGGTQGYLNREEIYIINIYIKVFLTNTREIIVKR